jgi:hypothetical protein
LGAEFVVDQRPTHGLFGIRLSSRLLDFEQFTNDEAEKYAAWNRSNEGTAILPLGLSVEFDRAHPADLAYAKLRGALFVAYGVGKGDGKFAGQILDGALTIGLDHKTQFSADVNFGSLDMEQYFSFDRGGKAQLFLRGRLAAPFVSMGDSMRTLDPQDDYQSIVLGEAGIRLYKRVLLRGNASLKHFGGVIDDHATTTTDLKGFATQYGGSLDVQFKKRNSVYVKASRLDTSNLENNDGQKSVTVFTTGVQLNFH